MARSHRSLSVVYAVGWSATRGAQALNGRDPMASKGRPPKLLEKITIKRDKTFHNEDGSTVIEFVEEEATIFDAIVLALQCGSYIQDAAEAAGVSESGVHKWIARGQEHRPTDDSSVPPEHKLYVDFVEAVEKARAGAVLMNLDMVRVAAQQGSWQAAAWWLERTRPKQFGRRQAVELSGEVKTQPGTPDLSQLDLDEARELKRLLAKAQPEKVDA